MALLDEEEDPLDRIAPFRGASPAPLETTIEPEEPMARPESLLVRGTDPTKYRGVLRTTFAGNVQAAERVKREQSVFDQVTARRKQQEEAKKQAEAERQKAAEARQAQKDANVANEAEFKAKRVRHYKDDHGDIVPELDPNGRPVFDAHTFPVKYDDKGRAIETKLDETGTITSRDLDADSPIGTHPERPHELYKQNKHRGWDYVGPVEAGLQSTDERIKAAAEKGRVGLDKDFGKAAQKALAEREAKLVLDATTAQQAAASKAAALPAAQDRLNRATEALKQADGGIRRFFSSVPDDKKAQLRAEFEAAKQEHAAIEAGAFYDDTQHKADAEAAAQDEKLWRALLTTTGSVSAAAKKRREMIEAAGGDPEKDPILSAIQSRRAELGMSKYDAEEQKKIEEELRKHPALGPKLSERDALDKEEDAMRQAGTVDPAAQADLAARKEQWNTDWTATTKQAQADAEKAAKGPTQKALDTITSLTTERKGGAPMAALAERALDGDLKAQDELAKIPEYQTFKKELLARMQSEGWTPEEAQKKDAEFLRSRLSPAQQDMRDRADRVLSEKSQRSYSFGHDKNDLDGFKVNRGVGEDFDEAVLDAVSTGDLRPVDGQQLLAQKLDDEKTMRRTILAGLQRDRGLSGADAERAMAAMNPDEVERMLRQAQVDEFGSNSFSRAVAQGWLNLGASAANFTRIFVESDWARKNAAHLEEMAQSIPQVISSYRDIQGAGDVASYAAVALGQMAPSIAVTLGAGAIGRGALALAPATGRLAFAAEQASTLAVQARTAGNVARALQLEQRAEKIAKMAGALETNVGRAAAFTSSAIQEQGAIYGTMNDNSLANRLTALGFGSVAGALDSITAGRVMERIAAATSKNEARAILTNTLKELGKAARKDIPMEGVTEGAQTVLEKIAEGIANEHLEKLLTDPATWHEVVDATLMGVIGGAGMSAGTAPLTARSQHKAALQAEKVYQGAKPAIDAISALHSKLPISDDMLAKVPESVSSLTAEIGGVARGDIAGKMKEADAEIDRLQEELATAEKSGDLGQRNQLALKLAQTQQGKIELARTALKTADVEVAAQEIDALPTNPALAGLDPATAQTTQNASRALVKIAIGSPMETLTSAEQAALASPTPDGLPRIEMLKGADGKQHAIITQGAIDRLKSVAPAAAALIGESEAERRVAVMTPPTTAAAGQTARTTGKPTPQGQPQSGGTQSASSPANTNPAAAGQPELEAAVEANYQEAAAQLAKNGFTMDAGREKTLRAVVRIFTPALERYRQAFDSVTWQEEGKNSGGAGSLSSGNITFMMEDILRQDANGDFVNLPDLLNDPDRALKILEEEAIHGIAQKILSRAEVVGLWKKLPKDLQQLVTETYFEPEEVFDNEKFHFVAGHEFLRMVVQGKLDGKLSETTSPGVLAAVRKVLEKLLKYFQDLAANLRRSNVDEQTIAQIDSASVLIAEQIRKISSDAEAAHPYLSKNDTTTQGGSRNSTGKVETGRKTAAAGRGGNSQAAGDPATGGKGQVSGAPRGNTEADDDETLQRELAKLKAEADARQASDDRAKERRAAQVQTAANRLADFQDILAKVPDDARSIAEPLLNQAVKGEPGYVVGSNFTRLPSVLVGLPPGKVETSHAGADFKKNPAYGGENTRAYESDEAEQNKVRRIAMPGALDERTIASDTPSAAEGAPQIILAITSGADGKPEVHWQTAGGNGREMGINLAPLDDQERLSAEWQRKAERYGFQSFPEGWRGYRFLGVYDFRQAGQAKAYAELVDKLNPYSGVVQDIATRAEIDAADKVPVAAIADASLDMSGAQAQDYVRALLKTPGIGLDANLMNSVVKSPVSSQLYMQRLLLSAAFHSSPLSTFFFDQATANGAATVRALVRASTGAALQMRKKGAPEVADALGATLATIADYVRNGDKLDRAIGKAAEQMEMGEAGKVVNRIADALKDRVEYLPVNKRGKANLDAEATVEGFEQLMADLTRAVSNFTGEADLLGEAETLPQTIERGIQAHARRFEEYKTEAGLNSRTSKPAPRRMRELQTKQRVEGLTMSETRELEELERQAGQNFMPFFDSARPPVSTEPVGNTRGTQMALLSRESKAAEAITEDEKLAREGGTRTFPLAEGLTVERSGGEDRRNYIDAVWVMYQNAYSEIGMQAERGAESLLDDPLFDVVLNEQGVPVAFNISKITQWGYKSVSSGTDGSPDGKRAWRANLQRLKSPGYYAELSGAPRHIAEKDGIPALTAAQSAELLPGKQLTPGPTGEDYSRPMVINGLTKQVTKRIFGVPLLWKSIQTTEKPSTPSRLSETPAELQPSDDPNSRNSGTPFPRSTSIPPTSSTTTISGISEPLLSRRSKPDPNQPAFEFGSLTPPTNERRSPTPTDRRHASRTAPASGMHDLFQRLVGKRETERSERVVTWGEGDLFAAPRQPDVGNTPDRVGDGADSGRLGGSTEADDSSMGGDSDTGGDRPGGQSPADKGGIESSPRDRAPGLVERPADPAARNYVIARGAEISPRGLITKLRANLEAIRILKHIESESRPATAEERDALVKYSGWGALSQAFDDDKADRIGRGEIATRKQTAETYRGYGESAYYQGVVQQAEDEIRKLESWQDKWGDFHKQLKESLTPEEYRRAQRSTINAHYTAPDVISAMWDMAVRLGFKGGNVLEPAAGVGHFIGLMPPELADRTKAHAVELDDLSGRITRLLYPEADVQVTGFQTADLADNSIDLAISNVPFANVPVSDKAIEAMGGPVDNLHDYFFGKTLTKLRPGGLAMFITSAFTMDKGNATNRRWLAERADLVAGFRLPNDAFRANAGTDVVTDVIILRKKDGVIFDGAQDWTQLDDAKTASGSTIRVNQYFATHPANVLGLLADDGSMYGDEKEMTVHSDPSRPVNVALQQGIDSLPADIAGDGNGASVRTGNSSGAVKMGNIVRRNGKYFVQGQDEPDPDLNDPKNAGRVLHFIDVRDALNRQYELELSPDATDEQIEANRRTLNENYDFFVTKFGDFHHKKNKTLFIDDPDYFRLAGAEVPEKTAGGIAAMVAATKGNVYQKFIKADVFTRRVLSPRTEPTTAKTIEDAFGISLGWRGRVDTGLIADLLGQSREQVERGLVEREIAVRDPETGQIQSREQYLSGNVRHKLEVARASGPDYERNARLLEGVIPHDVGIEDIRFKIGATWIPATVYNQFLESLGISNAGITYHEPIAGGRDFWKVDAGKARFFGTAFKDYGTPRVSVLELMDSLLNMQRVTIEHTDKDRKGQTDVVATQAAKDAGKKLNAAFVAWAQKTPEVAARLAPIYNRQVNAFAQRTHDGQFLTFPWASNDFDIFPDKKNVVWRAIQDGFALVAHGVGGGKTILGTAIALELRRLGMARKPMIVVHNSTLEQFADSIARIAPSSRVLVGRKDELAGPKRKEFLMRIAAGDWDAVVVAHSTFGLIEDDPEYQQKHMQAIVDEVMASLKDSGFDSIDEAKKGGRKDMSVKQRVKTVETLEGKISELSKRRTDTGLLNFQQLGVDALIVDEIHEFKKMPFSTKLDVKGIDSGMSARGYAMLMRARNIQERMGGKNVFTMTGTPVTNTLGEVWNMVRLVAPHLLKEYQVETFDQFVSKFAEVETVSEETPSGERRMVERLSKVVNLPEWATFFRMAADVKFGDAMTVKGRPGIKGGKPQLVSVERTPGVASWVSYIREVLDGFTKLGREDFESNPGLVAVPVQAYMASRAAAIDIRLIDARAKDEPGSKTNRMLENALAIYERTTPYNGAQVVFADSYQTVKTSLFDAVVSKSGLNLELDPEKEPGSHFNLYEDIKAKLIARGVPENQIAIIADKKYDNAKAKKALFDDVNAGRVRIIMGSTQKLGTGVNMQERMAAAHHLDVPWTPAGLEQRDGRVYRQGNIHGEMGVDVELLRYGMKDSLDSALWQKLETKQRFITLSLSGKIAGRELEEVDEILSLAEQRAILSGPYGQELFELESRIRELNASEQGHSANVRARNFEIRAAKDGLRQAEEGYGRTGPALAAMRSLGEKISTDGVKLTVNGKAFETKTAMLEGVNAALDSARQAALAIAGEAKPVTEIAANGTLIRLNPEVSVQSEIDDDGRGHDVRRVTFTLEAATDDSPDFGRVSSAATLLARLEEVGGTVEGIEEARRNNLRRLQQIGAMSELGEWPHQAELDKAVARQAELRALMRAKPATATPAPAINSRQSKALPDTETMALDFQDGITPNERVVKNLGLAYSIAEKFLPSMPGADRDDARSHARQALMRAARSYDSEKGPFGPYAAAAISNELRTTLGKYQTHADRFKAVLDEPTISGDGETTRKDMLAGTEDVERDAARAETTNILDQLIAELPDHLRSVVEGVREGRTLEDIGAGLGGMTKQAVGNRAKIAFTKLRQKLGEKGITGAQDGMLNARASKPLHEMSPHDAMAQLQRLAGAETPGQRTIGRPDLALGTLDTLIMSVDEWRKGWLKPETHADWQAKADKMLADDYQGTKDRLMSAALSGASLSPEDVKAAMMLVQREVQKVAMNPGNIGQRNDVQLLVNAYRQARTEAARGLAAGRDPFKTPEERHREFLAKVIFTPPEKVRKQLDDAKTPDEKQKILDEDRKRIAKIEAELAKMGVTFGDIFSGAAELRLKAAKVAKTTLDIFKDKDRSAVEMLMAGKPFAEVSGKTGIGVERLKNLKQSAIAELRKKHFAKFKAGATMANVDALKAKAAVSDADAEAEFARFLDALGLVPDDRQGKRRFDASSPVDVVRVARTAQAATSNVLDMVYEAWINNILSGPATHFVNIAGNFANAAWAYSGQRGVESLLNLAMQNGDGPQVEEFKYLFAGLGKRMMEASKLAAMAWSAEYDFTEHHYLDQPVDLTTPSDKTGFVRAAIPGAIGRVVRIPGRALMWADSFFKSMIAQTEAAMQAHRMAKAEGLKGTALKARWEELMKPGSPAWEKAMETAKEHTFQQDIRKKDEGGGYLEDAVARMTEARGDNILLAFLMPFVRTPFNIFRIGLRKSPLGTLSFGSHLAKGVFGKIRDGKPVAAGWGDSQTMIRDLAEQAMAWTAFAIVWGMAQGDDDDDQKRILFTGSMPMQETTRGERDLQQRAYGGSYMVRIGGRGGMEFNYGRYEPFATVLGTTVDVIRAMKRGTPAADRMDALWGYFVAQAQSKTFLQGVSDFTKAIQDGKGAGDKLTRAIVQALVPNIIRQPLRNLDDYVRDTKSGGLTYTALPAAGNAPQKLDAYGKPIEKDGNALSRLLLPTGTKPYEHLTKADEVLLRWNTRNPTEKWAPQPPERQYTRDGKHTEMTAEQYSKFTALVGQRVNAKLAAIIRPGATTNPTEKDVKAIRGAFEDARREAREQMFPKGPSVREALWR